MPDLAGMLSAVVEIRKEAELSIMRNFVSLFIASAALAGLASACSVDTPGVEEVDSSGSEQAACANPEGTNAMIAALAVAVGQELGRWKVGTDFKIIRGTYNQEHLQLTPAGLSQCAANKVPGCPNVSALLFFQDARYDNYIRFPGNVTLSAWSYAARLTAGYKEQLTCEQRAVNKPNNPDACPAEEHKLTLQGVAPGPCDVDFTFKARTPHGANLKMPQLLKNKLLWAGKYNPYIAFKSTPDTVTIDPTWDLNQGASTSGGSCVASCQKYDRSKNWTNSCCSCNGKSGKFLKPVTANVYKCSAG